MGAGKMAVSELSSTPAGCTTRDKLRARNAIFKVTGFLEGHVNMPISAQCGLGPRRAGGLTNGLKEHGGQAPLSAPEAQVVAT